MDTVATRDINASRAVGQDFSLKAPRGNLVIESLQDSSTYQQKSSSGFAASLYIPPICYGSSSASISGGRSKTNSNYQSVGEKAPSAQATAALTCT